MYLDRIVLFAPDLLTRCAGLQDMSGAVADGRGAHDILVYHSFGVALVGKLGNPVEIPTLVRLSLLRELSRLLLDA